MFELIVTLATLAAISAAPAAPAPESTAWPFLPLSGTGAREFVRSHPKWDGRGVVIAILDTGVDPGLSGLQETSDGLPKILDCRDFSGEGDVALEILKRIENPGGAIRWRTKDGTELEGLEKLPLAPRDSVVLGGFLAEGSQKNSSVPDLNGNGSTDDRFAIVAFEAATGDSTAWFAAVDTDGDGDIGEEKLLRDFDVSRDTFVLEPSPKRDVRHPLTFSLHIDGDAKLVSVAFDDGAHGSHVAGIAAGYKLNGVEGMNGVAPGAQILSLKIGNNTLSGGATTTASMKKAFEYAARWAEEHDRPLVTNTSYGIGNAWEGRAEIDSFLTNLLLEHPNVVSAFSAGNEGPGLSTVGTPGSCPLVVTAGAWIGAEEGEPLYGALRLPREGVLLHFSSRGGELAKPDVVTPGAASSSVPPFEGGDRYWGTSMASPQVAGSLALLASACVAEKRPVIAAYLKEALREGAKPLAGVSPVDQGAGLVQVPAAWTWLEKNLRAGTKPGLAGYAVRTFSATLPANDATAVYWRTSIAEPLPSADEKQRVTIEPLFYKDYPADARTRFYEAFSVSAGAPWVRVDRKADYIRNKARAEFGVFFDRAALKAPGFYTTRIVATPSSGASPFRVDIPVTVARPRLFPMDEGARLDLGRNSLAPGMLARVFVEIPPSTASLAVDLSRQSAGGRLRVYLFDPSGTPRGLNEEVVDFARTARRRLLANFPEPSPGVYELDLIADFANPSDLSFDAAVTVTGLLMTPDTSVPMPAGQAGRAEERPFVLEGLFGWPARIDAEGAIDRLVRASSHQVERGDIVRVPVYVDRNVSGVTLRVQMDPETYSLLTDAAINLLDPDGKSVSATAMGSPDESVRWDVPEDVAISAEPYQLEIRAGFTSEDDRERWAVKVTESSFLRNPVAVRVENRPEKEEKAPLRLPAGAVRPVVLRADDALPGAPQGYALAGSILFRDPERDVDLATVPFTWPAP